MTKKHKTQGVDRRSALKTIGSATALVAGAAATAHWKRSFAQSKKLVRVWTTQVAPDQLKGYDYYKSTFEEAHPGIEIAWEHVSDDDAWPKLTAAYAGGNPPEIVSNLTPAWNATLYDQGKLEMMEDVAEAVGMSDWVASALALHTAPNGDVYGVPIGGTAFSTMWYRKSLFEKAGVEPPKDWAESVEVFKKVQTGGLYAHPHCYASGGMANTVGWCMMNKGGSSTVTTDLKNNLPNDGLEASLEYFKEIRPYSPPGATGYSYGDSLSAFVSGRTVTGWYTGRALMNVNTQNPKILDDVGAVPWPSRDAMKPFDMGGYHSHWICKGAKNIPEAKLVATWHYTGTGPQGGVYAKWLHGAPSHLLPILNSTMESDDYWAHPLLKRKKAEAQVMLKELANGYTRVKESAKHPINFKMGAIMGTNVFALMIQKYVINKEPIKQVMQWGADEVERVLQGK